MPLITADPSAARRAGLDPGRRHLVLVTAATRAPPDWQLHPNMAGDPDASPPDDAPAVATDPAAGDRGTATTVIPLRR